MKFKSLLSYPAYCLLLILGVLISLSIINNSLPLIFETKQQLATMDAEKFTVHILLLSLVRQIIPIKIGIIMSIFLPIMTSIGNFFINRDRKEHKQLPIYYNYVNITLVTSILLLLGALIGGIISYITATSTGNIKFVDIFKYLGAKDILNLVLKTFLFSSFLFLIHKFQFLFLSKKVNKTKKIIVSFLAVIIGFVGIIILDIIITATFYYWKI